MKKKIVDTLVEKVTIDKYRTLHVHIRLNLLRILEDDANRGGSIESEPAVATEKGGIYTRIPTSPAHRHLRAICALPSRQASL